jgi:arabinofuranan 3-O-arabinosyltransferase
MTHLPLVNLSNPPSAGEQASRALTLVGFGLTVTIAAWLATSLATGAWLIDPSGRAIATDFVNVWAAGRQALDGQAAAAFDWTAHKAAENAAVGHAFAGFYEWLYPPSYLLVAALMALMPYTAAQALWLLATFPLYVAAVRAIIGQRLGIVVACGFPAVLANAMAGQNGFLTAALMGGSLHFMERRPALAGCLLGLMTYKPHLGILFPLVLVASGRWRVVAAATATAVGIMAVSLIAFGSEAWIEFFRSLAVGSQATLSEGQADLFKIQTVFGLARSLGGGERLAWSLQVMLIVALAVMLCRLWRSRESFNVKAAALSAGALLATPYLFLYDLVVLAVPLAYLVRASLAGGFLPRELLGLGAVVGLILIFPFIVAPVGLLATTLTALMIWQRCRVS